MCSVADGSGTNRSGSRTAPMAPPRTIDTRCIDSRYSAAPTAPCQGRPRSSGGPVEGTVPANRAITVRELLTFSMGFGGYFGPCPVNDMAAPLELSVGPPQPQLPPEPDEWMRRFSTLPLMCQPGERWLYHTGADVLGVLIARASGGGQSFEAFLRERIFEPLGMKDTAFSVPAGALDRLGTLYLTDPETGALTVFDPPDGQWSRPPAFPSGGAGLVSTADDF